MYGEEDKDFRIALRGTQKKALSSKALHNMKDANN